MKKLSVLLLLVVVPARADERDGLPQGAVLRLGSLRWRAGASVTLTAFRNGGRELLALSADRIVVVWDIDSERELRRFDVSGPPLSPNENPVSPEAGRVAVSADGRRVAAVCRDQTARVFDADTGKEITKIDKVNTECLPVLSADGKLLALYQSGGHTNVWDVAKKDVLASLFDTPPAHGGANYVYRLGFSTDGKTLTQVGMTYRPNGGVVPHVVCWDVAKRERIKQIDELPTGTERDAVFRAFPARDGKSLFVPTPNSLVQMDLTTGMELRRFKDVEHVAASSFVTTPDGKDLVQLIGRGEALVVWDIAKGEIARRYGKADENTANRSLLWSLSIAPDGKMLAYGDGAMVTLIDLTTGKKRGENEGHSTALMGAYYSPDGKTILTRADRCHIRWDAANGKFIERFDVAEPLTTFLLTRDAKSMIATDRNMVLHILDAATRKELRTIPLGLQSTYTYTVAPDSRTLIVLARRASHLHFFDLTTGQKTGEVLLPPGEPEDRYAVDVPRRLNTSPDARYVVGSVEKALIVWGLNGRREVQRIDIPSSRMLRHVTFGPDGRTLAVEFYGGEIGVWEIASGTRRRLLVEGKTAPTFNDLVDRYQYDGSRLPAALAFSLDGRLVANAGPDRAIRLFDARTGRELDVLRGHQGAITAVSFSPDSTRLISACADTTALVWDLAAVRAKLVTSPASLTTPDALWAALGAADAGKAYEAILSLAAGPVEGVAFLRKRLPPVAAADEKQLAKLITDLDAPKYAERQKARKELEKLGDLALPALQKALEAKGSVELQSAARRLLETISSRRLTNEQLRQVRAVEAVEMMATPEAQALLKSLAAGAPAAPLTIEAKLALERLAEKK